MADNDTADEIFAPAAVTVSRQCDGSMLVENTMPLADVPDTVVDVLESWVAKQPDATLFAEKRDGEWRSASYGDFWSRVEARASRLLNADCNGDRPLMVLAPNSIEHAVTMFACMMVGIPVSSISPAYGTAGGDYARLLQLVEILGPGAIYVDPLPSFADAVEAIKAKTGLQVLGTTNDDTNAVVAFDALEKAPASSVAAARTRVDGHSVAKILFTSGSTGLPKGVMNTHRMLSSNQIALRQVWPFLAEHPPRLLDWLPWSHTFGGNVCLNSVIFNGGSLYIDDGKPAAGLIERSVQNFRDVAQTVHFNVPAGVEALLPFLENDPEFARRFFVDLKVFFVAAAALPQKTRDRVAQAGLKATGRPVVFSAGWGSTETAPFSTCVHDASDRADNIGIPIPGTSVKLTPDQGKLALSVKGPNVTPGYWRNSAATREAFDADGFYRMGDAGELLNAERPADGIVFNGRLSENFKLLSGTWVNVNKVRLGILPLLRPYFTDAVVTGHNRHDIGLLLVPNPAALKPVMNPDDIPAEALAVPTVREAVQQALDIYNRDHPRSSTKVARCGILPDLPSLATGEITDKGYLNQRRLTERWADLIEQLHAVPGANRQSLRFLLARNA